MTPVDNVRVQAPGRRGSGSSLSASAMSAHVQVGKFDTATSMQSSQQLCWMNLDPASVATGKKTTTSRKQVRSHVMLKVSRPLNDDHRRRQRIADTKKFNRIRGVNKPLLPSPPKAGDGPPKRDVSPSSPMSIQSLRLEEDCPVRPRSTTSDNGISGRTSPIPIDPQEVVFGGMHTFLPRFRSGTDFRLQRRESTEDTVTPNLLDYIAQGSHDPFASMAVELTPRMRGHLYYFVNVLVPLCFPIRGKNRTRLQAGWGPFAQANPTLMHALVATGATSQAMWEGELMRPDLKQRVQERLVGQNSMDSLTFKAETARLINEKLSDPVEAASDATIAAVAILASTETLTGHIDQVRIHLRGLRQMVDMRGDMSGLPSPILSQIAITDIKVAMVTLTKPFFPFIISAGDIPDSTTPILPKLGTRLLSLERSHPHLLHPEIISCIKDLLDLVRYAERYRSIQGQVFEESISESEFYDSRTLYVEYRLLSFPYDYQNVKTIQNSNPLQECIRLALLLFINSALWHSWPPSSAIVRSPLTALHRALEATNVMFLWQLNPDVLMWILFIGANASLGQVERPWFVEMLGSGNAMFRLGNEWWEVERRLHCCFYLEPVYGVAFEGIWDEAKAAERVQHRDEHNAHDRRREDL